MKSRKLIGIIIFTIVVLFVGRNLNFLPKISAPNLEGREQTDLKLDIQKMAFDQKGFYSVYFVDLKNGTHFAIDDKQIETAASVNKVPIVAALYTLATKGNLSLDDRVTIQANDIQDYGTGSLRYEQPGGSYTLRNLARLSLQQSDNTAAHVLAVTIGMDKIQQLVNSWGMTQTNMANDKSTVYDMSLLFTKIYDGEIANVALTKELLNFLTNSDFEDRLPHELPKGTPVYHKTGDGLGEIHDVGIIDTGKKSYYLGIMTSDVGDNEQATKDAIAKISKKVFDFEVN
jgi:beta-lactamase class A